MHEAALIEMNKRMKSMSKNMELMQKAISQGISAGKSSTTSEFSAMTGLSGNASTSVVTSPPMGRPPLSD